MASETQTQPCDREQCSEGPGFQPVGLPTLRDTLCARPVRVASLLCAVVYALVGKEKLEITEVKGTGAESLGNIHRI